MRDASVPTAPSSLRLLPERGWAGESLEEDEAAVIVGVVFLALVTLGFLAVGKGASSIFFSPGTAT